MSSCLLIYFFPIGFIWAIIWSWVCEGGDTEVIQRIKLISPIIDIPCPANKTRRSKLSSISHSFLCFEVHGWISFLTIYCRLPYVWLGSSYWEDFLKVLPGSIGWRVSAVNHDPHLKIFIFNQENKTFSSLYNTYSKRNSFSIYKLVALSSRLGRNGTSCTCLDINILSS